MDNSICCFACPKCKAMLAKKLRPAYCYRCGAKIGRKEKTRS